MGRLPGFQDGPPAAFRRTPSQAPIRCPRLLPAADRVVVFDIDVVIVVVEADGGRCLSGGLVARASPQLFGELLDRVRGGRAHLLDVGIEFGAAILGALLYMQMNQFMLWWQSQANHWRQLRSRGIMSLGKVRLPRRGRTTVASAGAVDSGTHIASLNATTSGGLVGRALALEGRVLSSSSDMVMALARIMLVSNATLAGGSFSIGKRF